MHLMCKLEANQCGFRDAMAENRPVCGFRDAMAENRPFRTVTF